LQDILESQDRLANFFVGGHQTFQELNLDVSTEELLSTERAFTYADLYGMVRNTDTLAWLTPHAAVARDGGLAMHALENMDETCWFVFNADGKQVFAVARSLEHLLEICDVVVRMLAVGAVHRVILRNRSYHDIASISAPVLAYLMEQCQSLKVLRLEQIDLDEDHSRVLGAYSRPGLEIILEDCKITSAGASTLVEVLGRNQGPTTLIFCNIDNFVLANGLRGNSRLKSFRPRLSDSPDDGNREVLAIADALKENKGLVDLDLWQYFRMNDETWNAVCDSLKTHPTLEVLGLRSVSTNATTAPALLNTKIQALVKMLKINMSIHTIHLHSHYSRHEIFRESVIPYLETNRLRPRLLAIQKTRPIPYRAKVLGTALLSARSDANSFWMLLSGNAEVAFPSRTTAIAAAANLSAPATAAAASTVHVATVTASVMAALTATAAGSLTVAALVTATSAAIPSAASDDFASAPTVAAADANVGTSSVGTYSAGHKRKARP
jgi:hypothetical protein